MTQYENKTETDNINHVDPLLSDFKNMNVNKMKQNKKLKNKIEKSIKEYKYILENIDVLFRSDVHTTTEIRDKIKETEGKIFALYWVLDQLEAKKKRTSDYEGCKSYITEC